MPKQKKPKETPKQQAARFAAEVERMKAAGELNPTEADNALDKLLSSVKLKNDHTS
ncbi:hypothetical protein [Novosphingobium sp.]|uniref:hypothetical protein n=1 Tax=Novosphingobium sp. TaxID=1874826 RepID=UPI0035B3745F